VKEIPFHLHAAGVLAPGLASLAQLRAVSGGAQPHVSTPLQLPSPAMLPSHERRRASQAVRLALACIAQALESCPFPAETLRSVFATDEGTGEVCQQMLEILGATRQVSPLLFPNSVLNAPSGYFSIAWRNRQPTNAVSMGLESFACGLLCAVTDSLAAGEPVMLVAYDPVMPSPMNEVLAVAEATASAWIISCQSPAPGVPVLASFTLALEPAGTRSPSPLPAWLPAAWTGHSSARGLAALGLIDSPPGTACHYPLGVQLVTLRRIDGGAA
jgi:hypothetical protein